MGPVLVGSVSEVRLPFLDIPQVLISMVYLPEVMPASFQAIYTPVESAGTEAQIKHLARLMATQMTAAGLGPGECQSHGADLDQRLALRLVGSPSWKSASLRWCR